MSLPKRILICGDSRVLLDRLHTWLHDDSRFTVMRADNFEHAKYLIGSDPAYDLIVTDLRGLVAMRYFIILEAQGRLVLHLSDYPVSKSHYLIREELTEETFIAKIAALTDADERRSQ